MQILSIQKWLELSSHFRRRRVFCFSHSHTAHHRPIEEVKQTKIATFIVINKNVIESTGVNWINKYLTNWLLLMLLASGHSNWTKAFVIGALCLCVRQVRANRALCADLRSFLWSLGLDCRGLFFGSSAKQRTLFYVPLASQSNATQRTAISFVCSATW